MKRELALRVVSFFSSRIAASPRWRYRLSEIGNSEEFQPLTCVLANRVDYGLHNLQKCGFSPDLVVDAGAYTGEWTRMALPCFPESRFLLIEAQPGKEKDLLAVQSAHGNRVAYEISLLGAENRSAVDFFLGETGSTLYPELTSFDQQRVQLPMVTLDDLVEKRGCPGRIFLKLDVQGAELDVLAGAEKTLSRTDAILLEASIVEYNEGAPRIADVIANLKERDFVLFDILDLRRIGRVLAQTDLLFVRRGCPLEHFAAETIRGFGAASNGHG